MFDLTKEYISRQIADSDIIFQRGERIYENGSFMCLDANLEKGHFVYDIDGNYGDYAARVELLKDGLSSSCSCPYPEDGCKHTVAVLLDVRDKLTGWQNYLSQKIIKDEDLTEPYLTAAEIRAQALEDRQKRAKLETFKVIAGDMYKGEHLVETPKGRQYLVTLHDPRTGRGHCSCPDFATNRLETCKHIIFLSQQFQEKRDFKKRIARERFPFVDIFWDSNHDRPRLFYELTASKLADIRELLEEYFDGQGLFTPKHLSAFLTFLSQIRGNKRVRVQESVIKRIDDYLAAQQLQELAQNNGLSLSILKTDLYPYQEEGVRFGLYRRSALIGDEMGLGKTLQAIALGILKRELYGFNKVLVVTLASLKEQWKREIERFSDEKAAIVAGSPLKRQEIYAQDDSLFKITNYEAVLRDVTIISRFKPDLLILDEAQRIKNFNTKTADAVKGLPRKHALVLTGTPLENKLEDIYSIVQFLDPNMLSPLWQFAADHFMLSRTKKGKILGYRNLDMLHEKLQAIVIRRRKEEVLSDLPDEVVNNYYVDLTSKQAKIHNGYAQLLMPLLNKKYLTPMDLQRMMELLLKMRMVCDSTYLIDRRTHLSPKLKELEGILEELVLQSNRKVVIFSEWTTMTFLIAKHLSQAGISFVELSGKVPVPKRQALIDEFTHNPDCRVFLSTDAGGTGLNLQAADCVINFEMPWNPAKINQRIGRVNRIGQKSGCVNVVNLIAKDSIEEKIVAGLQLKTDLFEGVFDGGKDVVEFSHAKRTELLNRLRAMMGEEPLVAVPEQRAGEEIPEDTPHYLNPKALGKEDQMVAYDAEERTPEDSRPTVSDSTSAERVETETSEESVGESPEKMEQVLNSGMQFMGGLLEMATGKKFEPTADDDRLVHIDKQTGEVTLRFKLPGF